MKQLIVTYLFDPAISWGFSIGTLWKTGVYDLTAQLPTDLGKDVSNIGATGILAIAVWFLLVRMQGSIDKNTLATEAVGRGIEKLVERLDK